MARPRPQPRTEVVASLGITERSTSPSHHARGSIEVLSHMRPNHRKRLALGTAQFGFAYGIAGSGSPVAETMIGAILDRAEAAGITRLDTAAAYGDIEQRLARLIRDRSFRIVSKISQIPRGLEESDQVAFVRSAVRESHGRLGELMVGLLFHDADDVSLRAGDAVWKAASEECARLGVALGVSGYDPRVLADIAGYRDLAMTQLPANALDQRFREHAIDLSGSEVTLRSIYLQGLLLMDENEAAARIPPAAAALRVWHQWCKANDLSPLEAALGIAKGFVADFYVFGVDNVEQLDALAESWQAARSMTAPALASSDPAIIDPRCWADRP